MFEALIHSSYNASAHLSNFIANGTNALNPLQIAILCQDAEQVALSQC